MAHPDSPAPILVVFEDNHLLVVEKPPNIPTQADASGDPDLLGLLKADLKLRYAKPGNVFLGLVHRLDRPVGGVMVFAKTSKAAARLADQVRERRLEKIYHAVLHGVPDNREGELRHFMVKDPETNTSRVVPPAYPGAKEAILNYQVIANRDSLSLVRIQLRTGRSHQIRVQMAAIGHPLYGDQKYGATRNQPGQQLALWAVQLGFDHPTKGERLNFTSTPPNLYPWNQFAPNQISIQ